MTIDLSQFHQVFFEESIEGLDIMEAALMELDADAVDSEIINSIFRAAHSIKGGSATFGFGSVAEFTHDMETILDQVRDGRRNISTDDINLFLQSVDCMREMLSLLQTGGDGYTAKAEELKLKFASMLSRKTQSRIESTASEAESEVIISDGATTSPRQREKTWRIYFKPGADTLRTGNEPGRLLNALSDMGQLHVICNSNDLPKFTALESEQCYLSWDMELRSTTADKDAIQEIFEWVVDESELEILESGVIDKDQSSSAESELQTDAQIDLIKPADEKIVGITSKTSAQERNENTATVATGKAASGESSSIRVGIDKIDNLINMVGELVITQSMLGQLGTDFDVNLLPKLMEGLGQLEQNTRELQESVMRIRMLPISFAFSRFPRMVRDLGQKLQKSVNLVMIGEQTELDKTVMEKIGDPLVHLVRNAVDHGIELPAERLEKRKSETGTVTLNAYHQSGNVVIEIKDDGKGLDKELLKNKAIEKGIMTKVEVDLLSDEHVYDLIFHPGFSTAKEVSDVSGRGVGMDVVKRNIQALNGAVELKSEKDKGSTISIRLPLTLAILDGQLVRVGTSIYIFPLVSIVESMQYKEENVNEIAGGCNVFRLRDDYVPVVELHRVFSVPADSNNLENALMVVVESDGEKLGIVVDELLAQQQVVIKSLEQNYKRVDGVSGATILGDGTVALILDIPGIVKLAGVNFRESQAFMAARRSAEYRVNQAAS